MYSRVLAILRSTADRESTRIDLLLTRAVFLIIAGLVLLPAVRLSGGSTPIGPYMLQALFPPSVFLMVFLAVRLGGDSVGDVRCGMLELLFLSDTKPGQWVLVRVAQMWIAFLAVWAFRAPLLFIVFSLGGLRPQAILVSELLLMIGFLFLSSLALLVSFVARSRRQLFGIVLGGVLVWEFLIRAPGIAAGVMSRYYNWSVPPQIVSAADTIRDVGLTACFRTAVIRSIALNDILATMGLYSLLSLLILACFRRLLTVYASGASVSHRESKDAGDVPRRESRRCWNDALAWQAFTVHGGGRRLVQAKCIGFVLFGAGMWYLATRGFADSAFVISVAAAAGMLLISINKAGDCLSREIRERTITMLLLTPNGPDDFYAGWQRGALRLAWPDVVLGIGVTLVSFLTDSAAPPVLVAIGAALLASGPFLMLSPLVPFSAGGIATGVFLILGLLLIVIITAIVGVTVSPFAVPAVSIPAVVIYNQILRRLMLPYWMEQKLSSVV